MSLGSAYLSTAASPPDVDASPAPGSPASLLAGSRLLISGVLTHQSIAFGVAERAQRAGAKIVLTTFGRTRRLTERAARRLPDPPDVLELDVAREEDFAELATELDGRWGGVDGALHAVAFAPADALSGNFLAAPASSAQQAFMTSAYSFKAMAESLAPLMPSGGSLVGLDFDASVAWPAYDWMGVSKAALESVSRYLARDLGGHGIRVNLVAAGPIATVAAGGIPGFGELAGGWEQQAPLGWDPRDATPVADAVCFLLSPWSRAITGEILHVDGGFHAMGAPMNAWGTLEDRKTDESR